MTPQSIHDLEPQLAANRRYWCGWAGSHSDTDLPSYRTDIEQPLLNGILRVRNQPLDEAIDEATKRLAGSVWSWWVGADSDEGTAEGLLARGAEQTVDMPVMAVDVTTVSGVEASADLTIRRVTNASEMREYVQAYAVPLGFTVDNLDPVVERELNFAYPEVVRLAAIVDNTTVGTCTISLATEVGALYCIATDPAYRRRGIATALTQDAVRIIRESGRRIVTLQASSEGEPDYSRLGSEEVGRYRLYTFAQ